MSLPNNQERLTYEPAQSEAAAGIVGYNLDNLENRQARREFLTYLGAMRYEALSPADQGRLDGMMAAQRRLNETLYHYNFHGGEIAEGARQLEDALKGLADIFGSAPDAVWGQPANQVPYRRQRTVEGIRSVARDIANDPEEARRIAEAARQAREQQEATRRAAEEARARSIESAGLSRNQASLLSAPKLKITSIITQVQAQFPKVPNTATQAEKVARNDQAMALFKEKLTDKVMVSIDDWLATNRQYAQGPQVDDSSRLRKEAWKAEGFNGHFDVALAGDALNLGVDGLKGIVGNLGGLAGNADLDNFPPELSAIFQTQEDYQKFFGLLKDDSRDNKEAIKTLVAGKVDELFPTGSSFTGVEQMFAAYNVPDDQLTPDQLDDIIGKLQRIPKYFRHFQSDLVEQYETYLRSDAAGPGAIEFQEWVMQRENLGMFQRIIFNLVFSFPGIADWMTDWFDGAEADKTEAQKRGATLHKYMELKETAAPTAPTGPERELKESPHYLRLLATFNAARAGAETLDLRFEGKKLEDVKSVDITKMETDLSSIESFLQKRPQAYKMLIKGAELKDVAHIVETLNALESHIEFSADGINVDIENALLSTNFGMQDVASLGGGLAAGFGAKYWLMSRQFLSREGQRLRNAGRFGLRHVKNFAARGGWRGRLVGLGLSVAAAVPVDSFLDFFNGDSVELKYDQLTPANIHYVSSIIKAARGEISSDVASQESLDFFNRQFADRLAPGANLETLIDPDTGNFPHAFSALMGAPDSFWGTYKMTQDDINNFAKEVDYGWLDFSGDINDKFDAISDDDNDGEFIVDGSGYWFLLGFLRKGVTSADDFFKWLRTK